MYQLIPTAYNVVDENGSNIGALQQGSTGYWSVRVERKLHNALYDHREEYFTTLNTRFGVAEDAAKALEELASIAGVQ